MRVVEPSAHGKQKVDPLDEANAPIGQLEHGWRPEAEKNPTGQRAWQ